MSTSTSSSTPASGAAGATGATRAAGATDATRAADSVTGRHSVEPLRIVCVCSGNICRSPMAEVILTSALADAGLSDSVAVSSCGIGAWHVGEGADRRAVAELASAGYDGTRHRAQQLSEELATADMLLAADHGHVRDMLDFGVDPERIRLIRSFDPDAPRDAELDDPYYGGASGFTTVREQIESAVPGIVAWARESASLS